MLKWSDLISLISSMVNRRPGGPSRERTHKTSCDGTSGRLDAPGPSQPGVSLRPHQSEQTRQGPDAVTGTGWLVSLGSSCWDLHPSCVNHDSKHTQDYQHSRNTWDFHSYMVQFSYYFTEQHMTKWVRNGYWAINRQKVAHFPEASFEVLSETRSLSHLSLKE